MCFVNFFGHMLTNGTPTLYCRSHTPWVYVVNDLGTEENEGMMVSV